MNDWKDEDRNHRKIELAFPKYEQEYDNGAFISKGGRGEGLVKPLSANIDDNVTYESTREAVIRCMADLPNCTLL